MIIIVVVYPFRARSAVILRLAWLRAEEWEQVHLIAAPPGRPE